MDAAATVRLYYDALRDGDPLYPFFAAETDPVKFGLTERLAGHEAVREGLREQTRTTTDWDVRSRDLRATERDRHAWFSDDVFMAWTDTETGVRYSFDARWSGTLERQEREPTGRESDDGRGQDDGPETDDDVPGWRFVGMHVSRAVADLESGSNRDEGDKSAESAEKPRRRPVDEDDS